MALYPSHGFDTLPDPFPVRTGRQPRPAPPPKAPSLDDALRKLRALPPLSMVAAQLLQQISKENVGFKSVSELIRSDAPLTADLLRIANSALFGSRFPVTGVLHALAMLGMDRVRSMVTTAALKHFVGPGAGTPAMQRCWRHNLACALLSDEAAHNAHLDRDFAYTAGLLHDIGRLAMMGVWPKQYSELLDSATVDGAGLLPLERREFGLPHTLAGFALLQHWKLPLIFADICDRHHDPPPEGSRDVLAIVSFSCQLADQLGFSAIEQDPPPTTGRASEAYVRIGARINELECCLGF